eukprot:2827669-Rhodomonas_salina.2
MPASTELSTGQGHGHGSCRKRKGSAGLAEDSGDEFCRRRDADWLVHERYNRYFGAGDDEGEAADAEPAYDEGDDDDLIEDDDFDDYDDYDNADSP